MSDAAPSEVQFDPTAPPAPTALPEPVRRTLAAWRPIKRHWLHDAACIAAGWTVAQRESVEPLTYTEAEYDAGIAAAGETKLGGMRPTQPTK